MPFPIATLFAEAYPDALERPPGTVAPAKAIPGFVSGQPPLEAPVGSRCVLCGDPLAAGGYPFVMSEGMTDFAGFRGLMDQPVAWCCRPCTIFQVVFWMPKPGSENADDERNAGVEEVAHEGKAPTKSERLLPPFKLVHGWYRFPVWSEAGGLPAMEHWSFAALRADPGAWAVLEGALRDPNAHTWALFSASTRRRMAPYLAYTPPRARHLQVLFVLPTGAKGSYPHVSTVVRGELWRLLALVGADARAQGLIAAERQLKARQKDQEQKKLTTNAATPDEIRAAAFKRAAGAWRSGRREAVAGPGLRSQGLPDLDDPLWRRLLMTLLPDAPMPDHWTPEFPGLLDEGVMVS